MHRLLLPLSFMVCFVSCGGGEEVAHAPGPGFDGGQGADDAAQGDSATGTDSAPWESGQSDGPQQGLEASPDALDAPFDAPEEAAPVDCQTYRTRHDLSSPPESASWRWGGGSDYPDRLAPNPSCTVEVSTLQELSNALENAVAGTIVYVRNEARIDLTGQSLCIPGGFG